MPPEHPGDCENQFLASGACASKLSGCTRAMTMNNMYKSVAALIACFLLTHSGAWPLDAVTAGSSTASSMAIAAGSATLPLLFTQESADQPGAPAGDAQAAEESEGSMPVAQQVVAGILTGMLAAILTLRIVFYRRRHRDQR